MATKQYIWIENGVYIDRFREYPLTSSDVSNVKAINYHGWCYVEGNTMRINPSGDPYGVVYDFEIGPCTPGSLEKDNAFESGYALGKRHARRVYPMDGDQYFRDGYCAAWRDKGKPIDEKYWREYWRKRRH